MVKVLLVLVRIKLVLSLSVCLNTCYQVAVTVAVLTVVNVWDTSVNAVKVER